MRIGGPTLTSPDGRYAFVATSGYNAHDLTAIDLASGEKVATVVRGESWFGLAADFKAQKFWWSGGGSGSLHAISWTDGKLTPIIGGELPKPPKPADKPPADKPAADKPAADKPATPALL